MLDNFTSNHYGWYFPHHHVLSTRVYGTVLDPVQEGTNHHWKNTAKQSREESGIIREWYRILYMSLSHYSCHCHCPVLIRVLS
mmetsp:Transcript_28287/g.31758  ORF Transcript_28287/g.31758 Transcript_28287/m.31758 type:complete len:83 (+) Transcript_28287:230-478(+)